MSQIFNNYINNGLSNNSVIFLCVASGIVKGMGEVIAARLALKALNYSYSAFGILIKPRRNGVDDFLINAVKQISETINNIFEKNDIFDYEYLSHLFILFIILDMLTSYALQMACDEIIQYKTDVMTLYLNERISGFFHYKQEFIQFIIRNASAMIRGDHQIIEVYVRNITLFIILIIYIRIRSIMYVILMSLFLIFIILGNVVQYQLSVIVININRSSALKDFVEKYKKISENNYLLIGSYGLLCCIYVYIFWKIKAIVKVNDLEIDIYRKLIVMICCILIIRIGINVKTNRFPLYLKRLSEMIKKNISSVMIFRIPTLINTNDYTQILLENVFIKIDYDTEIITLLKQTNMSFERGKSYLISTNNIGKTGILKTLFMQFCNNDTVYYVNNDTKCSINDIKDISKTVLLLDNNYDLKNGLTHSYDFLMNAHYYSPVKRLKLCKIMESINSHEIFIGIDNEMFVDFSQKEILRIFDYIAEHIKDKLLFVCTNHIDVLNDSILKKYQCYDIRDGSLVKIND